MRVLFRQRDLPNQNKWCILSGQPEKLTSQELFFKTEKEITWILFGPRSLTLCRPRFHIQTCFLGSEPRSWLSQESIVNGSWVLSSVDFISPEDVQVAINVDLSTYISNNHIFPWFDLRTKVARSENVPEEREIPRD